MNSQKILEIKQKAKDVFGYNFVNLGFGGSCILKEEPNDIDIILILHDFYKSQISEFIERCKLNISPCIITDFQADNLSLWPTKALSMASKHMIWTEKEIIVPREVLREVTKKNLQSDIYYIERKLINGELSYEKAFNFLRQAIIICQ